MKLLTISGRTAKEILRDPLNLFFGVGFPRHSGEHTGEYV